MREKKLLSVLICCVILFTFVPTAAFASEGGTVYYCGKTAGDGAHTHTDACYTSTLLCTQAEHTHVDGCYQLTCTTADHEHTAGCYTRICGMEEHTHTDACYTKVLTCSLEESAGHQHDNKCTLAPTTEPPLTLDEQLQKLISTLPAADTIDPTDETALEDIAAKLAAIDAFLVEHGLELSDEQQAVYDAVVVAAWPSNTLDNTNVAKIGEVEYATLDAAVEAAKDGETITMLANDFLTFSKMAEKSITFNGNGIITVENQTVNAYAKILTLDGTGIQFNWIGSGGNWLMMALSGTVNVINGAKLHFEFNSTTTSATNALYMNKGSTLNVSNGSTVEFFGSGTAGKDGQAIQLDKTAGASVSVTDNSVFLVDSTNRGYVNSPTVYVKDSTFTVRNCTNNGSNGGIFTAINSTITFENNAELGLSASKLTSTNSTFNLNDNGNAGLTITQQGSIDGTSKVYVNRNCERSFVYGAFISSGAVTFESGSVLEVCDNKSNGIRVLNGKIAWVSGNGSLNVEEGASVTIMNNIASRDSDPTNNADYGGSSLGGGIWTNSSVVIPSNAKLYNNHAATAGDDIYVAETGTIAFGSVGSDWYLDGTEGTNDCTSKIDGWYDDSADARWTTHEEPGHYVLKSAGKYTGLLALKAAHGIETEEVYTPLSYSFLKVDNSAKHNPVSGAEFTAYGSTAAETIESVINEINSTVKNSEKTELLKNIINLIKKHSGTQSDGLITLGPAVSDKDGKVIFNINTYPATYIIKETKTPDGYVDNNGILVLKVGKDGGTTSTALVNGELKQTTTYIPGEISVSAPMLTTAAVNGQLAVVNEATVDLTIKKQWVDVGNTSGRTSTVFVWLYADGKYDRQITLSSGNNWQEVLSDMPKYDSSGKEISYTVVERTTVPRYTTSYKYDGSTITVVNTRIGTFTGIRTGDDAPLALWAALAGISLAGLAAAVLITKRKKYGGKHGGK